MMLQLAFHGFMNGSNMAISGFRFFSLHSFGFMKEGKDDGKKRMMRTWGHILNGLCEVLKMILRSVRAYSMRILQKCSLQKSCFPSCWCQ